VSEKQTPQSIGHGDPYADILSRPWKSPAAWHSLGGALKRALANKTKLSELFRPFYSISQRTRGGAHFRGTQTAILHALRGKPKAVAPAPSAERYNMLFIGA
jgi:hypothetical protein